MQFPLQKACSAVPPLLFLTDRTLRNREVVEHGMNVAEEEIILSYYPDNSAQTVWKHDCHVRHREADDIVLLLYSGLKH